VGTCLRISLYFVLVNSQKSLSNSTFFSRTTEFTVHLQHKGLHVTPPSTKDTISCFDSVVYDVTLAIALHNLWVSFSEFLKN